MSAAPLRNTPVVDFAALPARTSEVPICARTALHFGIGSINVAVPSNNKPVKIFFMIVSSVGPSCSALEK